MADTLPPDLRESAQAALIALTCISTHPTLDMSDYLRGRVDAAAAGLEAALAAVPAQPVSLDQIQAGLVKAFGEPLARDDVLLRRIAEGIHAAAPQAVPVPEWQPIETAPKDGSLFLCWVHAVRYGETDEGQSFQQDASQVDFCSWRDGPSDLPEHGYFDPCCGQIGDSQDVTRWMPLPAAPKEQP